MIFPVRADDLADAEAALLRGDAAACLADAEARLARDPACVRALFLKGRAHLARAEFAQARPALAAAADLAPDEPAHLHELGRLHFADGRFDDAVVAFARAAFLDPAAATLRLLARSLEEGGRPEAARAMFMRALAAHPRDAGLRKDAERLFRRMGDYRAAAELYDSAGEPDANARMNRGLLRLAAGEAAQAAGEFRAARALRPDATKLAILHADALAAAGRTAEALLGYREALAAERPGEATRDLADPDLSAYPCLDFLAANALIRLARHADAAARLRAIYANQRTDALAALLFDDTLRFRGADDPSLLRSHAFGRDAAGEAGLAPGRLHRAEARRRANDREGLLAELLDAADGEDEAGRLGLRLLLLHLSPDPLPAGLAARCAPLFAMDPAAAAPPARQFFLAAERLRAGDLAAFAAALIDYLDADPALLVARTLLDRARPLDLAALELETIAPAPPRDGAGPAPLNPLLAGAAMRHAARVDRLAGEAARETAAERLAELGFPDAAFELLDAADAPFARRIALERLAFDAHDLARALRARQAAATSPDAEPTALRRALAFARRRDPGRLYDYALLFREGPDRAFLLAFSALGNGDAAGARALFAACAAEDRPYLEGRAALLDADLAGAAERFRQALARAPDDPECLKYLGITLGASGDHAAAVAPLRDAVRLSGGGDFDADRYLAATLERLGEAYEAERVHRAALSRRGPGRPLATRLYADFLARAGRHAEAVALYEGLCRERATPDLLFNLGLCRHAAGAFAAAAEAFRAALAAAPAGRARIEHHLALALAAAGCSDEASPLFRAAFDRFEAGEPDAEEADGATPYPCRAIVHAAAAVACGEWRACARILAAHLEELAAAPSDLLTDTEIVKGGLDLDAPFFFRFDRHPEEAAATGTDPGGHDDDTARTLAEFLSAQAGCRLDAAIAAGRRYLALDPGLLHVRRAMAARHRTARGASTLAPDAAPAPPRASPPSEDDPAIERRELDRLLAAGDRAGAAAFLRDRIARAGATATRWVALGETHWGDGRMAEAAEAFERALVLEPGHPYALVGSACTLRELGESSTAEIRFLEAARRVPAEASTEWLLNALWLMEARGALDEAADRAAAELPRTGFDGRVFEIAVRTLKMRGRHGDLKERLQAWEAADPHGRATAELLDLKQSLGEETGPLAERLFSLAPGDDRAARDLFDRALAAGDEARAAAVAGRYRAATGETALAHAMAARLADRAGSTELFLTRARRAAEMAGGGDDAGLHAEAKIAAGEDDAEFRAALRAFAARRGADLPAMSVPLRRALARGLPEMAQKVVNASADAAPESPVWRQLQADLFLARGKPADARAALEGALDDGTADLPLITMLVELHVEAGLRHAVAPLLERAAARRRDPATLAGIFRLAVAHGAHETAFALYKSLHARTAEGPARARAALDELRPDLLFALLDTIDRDEWDEPMLLSAARHKAASGDPAGALDLYEDALEERAAAESVLGAARALIALRRTDEAAALLARAASPAETAEDAGERLRLLARIRLARADFAAAEALLRDSLERVRHPEALRALGLCLIAQGRYADAERFLEEALLSLPDDVDALRHLAAARERLGRPAEADRLFRMALARAGPGRVVVARLHAESLARRGEVRAAVGLYARLLFDLPSPDIFFNLGTLLLDADDPVAALAALETAERAGGASPRIDYLIGVAHHRRGDRRQADERFARAFAGFERGDPDPPGESTPYPCRPLVHALAALRLGAYGRCAAALADHLEELARQGSDLLADADAIKGGVDPLEALLYRLEAAPLEHPSPLPPAVKDSVFGEPRRLLDRFLAAQEACDLSTSIELARRYLSLDPTLAHARARLLESAPKGKR